MTCVARTELTLFDVLAGLQREAGGPTPELQSGLAAAEEHLRSDPRPAIRVAARCALARFRPPAEAVRETDACIDEALAHGCAELAIPALASLSDAACCSVDNMFMVAFDPSTDFTIQPWREGNLGGGLELGVEARMRTL